MTEELYASSVESDMIQRYISSGDVVFDIGTYKGLWSDKVIERGPSVIHMFEPLVDQFQGLQKKYSSLISEGKVFVVNCAMFDSVGTEKFYYYKNYPTLSTIFRRINAEKDHGIGSPEEPVDIQITTIDYYCEEKGIEHINYMKTDVEGAEFSVLNGAEKFLTEHRIDYIEFEYGGTYLDSCIKLADVHEYLTKRSYRVFKAIVGGFVFIPTITPEIEDYEYSNFIALSPNVNFKGK